jgi:hypothetical protein
MIVSQARPGPAARWAPKRGRDTPPQIHAAACLACQHRDVPAPEPVWCRTGGGLHGEEVADDRDDPALH